MRWKLLVLASVSAAILGVGLWSSLVIVVFGSAWNLARHDWLLLASTIVPLGIAAYAGVFVYRHTARRRRTQAIFAVLFSLFLIPVAYFIARGILHNRLYIPRTYELRHAR